VIDRSIVGREYPPFSVEVEKRWVRSFAEAIGETDPIYLDEQAARAAGYRSLAVPPTFPFAAIMERNQSFMILDELGIDKRRTMHGEQSFAWHGDLCAGDVLNGRQRIVDVYDKKNGALEFIVCEIACTNQLGEPVCDLRTTIVVRN